MNEKRYLFLNAAGVWVFGDTLSCTTGTGQYSMYKTTVKVGVDTVDAVGFVHNSREGLDKAAIPVTDYLKNEAGQPYANLVELEGAIPAFFFRVSASISITPFRMQVRDGILYIDKILTPLGFSGIEDIDWQNVGSFK